jgi:hypothetical protein
VLAMVMERVLAVLVLLAGYCVLALVKPRKRCRKCSGWGSRKKRARRARSACGKCGATGRQFRPGARLVHGGAVLAADSIRDWFEQRREAD